MLRSFWAVLAGFLTTCLLVGITTMLAAILLLPISAAEPITPTPTYLAANLILSFLSAAVGGLVCAVIARRAVARHNGILAAILLILAAMSGILTGAQPGQPSWYPWVIGIIGASGIIAGGTLWCWRKGQWKKG